MYKTQNMKTEKPQHIPDNLYMIFQFVPCLLVWVTIRS